MLVNIQIPEKLLPFYTQSARFKIAYGGRSGGKTESLPQCLIARMLSWKKPDIKKNEKPCAVVNCREFLSSIGDSSYQVIVNNIRSLGLESEFKITENKITCLRNSAFILFKGLRRSLSSIKSIPNIKICWVEEADDVSKMSWDVLIPTIRAADSEIWISFNPKNYQDETYQRFVVNPKPNSLIVNINYYDNPFNQETILKEIYNWKITRPEDYRHIFLGEVKEQSEALIFKNKFEIKEFREYNWTEVLGRQFYYGADWGYAKDPTCIIRCFILEEFAPNTQIKVRNLYIDYEAGGIEVELTQIKDLFKQIPDIKRFFEGKIEYDPIKQIAPITIYGDNARPETISFLSNEGLPVYPCYKTEVESGIEFLKSFYKIYIHPRCKETINEFKKYSFKIDKNNGKILPKIDMEARVDNYIDSIRYAFSDLIRMGMQGQRTMTAYDYQQAMKNLR